MTKKTVLIVDDEIHIINVLSLKLRNANFEVMTAGNGEEALERIGESMPDLVITDFSMPMMTGLELVQCLRSDAKTEQIPVIMLTGRGQTVEEKDGKVPRIDVLMSKPFSPREILHQVETLLGVQC